MRRAQRVGPQQMNHVIGDLFSHAIPKTHLNSSPHCSHQLIETMVLYGGRSKPLLCIDMSVLVRLMSDSLTFPSRLYVLALIISQCTSLTASLSLAASNLEAQTEQLGTGNSSSLARCTLTITFTFADGLK